jgi:hypothetical protein
MIIGYQDSDFSDVPPFILQLPNTQTNFKEYKDEIEKFVLSWIGRRVDRESILNIDSEPKEIKRLKFFVDLLDSR